METAVLNTPISRVEIRKKLKKKFGESLADKILKTFEFAHQVDVDMLIDFFQNLAFTRECLDKALSDQWCINHTIELAKTFLGLILTPKPKPKEILDPLEVARKEGYQVITDYREIKAMKKYYRHNELPCTFQDFDHRAAGLDIFCLLVKDVNTLPSTTASRNDSYSKSIIFLQVNYKYRWYKSISRYNHSVNDCDHIPLSEEMVAAITSNYEGVQELQKPRYLKVICGSLFFYDALDDNGNYLNNDYILTLASTFPMKRNKRIINGVTYFEDCSWVIFPKIPNVVIESYGGRCFFLRIEGQPRIFSQEFPTDEFILNKINNN